MNVILVVVAFTILLTGKSTVDDQLSEFFACAKSGDLRRTEQLSKQLLARDTPSANLAVSIGMFMVNPARYRVQFVEEFPTSRDGLMTDLYSIEIAALTPSFMFSINRLGDLVAHGDSRALAKVIRAIPNSDGAIGQGLCDIFNKEIIAQPKNVLAEVARLSSNDRARNLDCLLLQEGLSQTVIEKLQPLCQEVESTSRKVITETFGRVCSSEQE